MLPILQSDAPVLRQAAEPISEHDFGGRELQTLIENMRAALDACADGVALAAPQIGVSKQIFIVSPKVFAEKEAGKTKSPELVYINPSIVKTSSEKKLLDEGCLSVRGVYGKIWRAQKTTVTAYDATGKKFSRGATDLLAQIFQHEVDHLMGILFIDKAINIEKVEIRNRSSELE